MLKSLVVRNIHRIFGHFPIVKKLSVNWGCAQRIARIKAGNGECLEGLELLQSKFSNPPRSRELIDYFAFASKYNVSSQAMTYASSLLKYEGYFGLLEQIGREVLDNELLCMFLVKTFQNEEFLSKYIDDERLDSLFLAILNQPNSLNCSTESVFFLETLKMRVSTPIKFIALEKYYHQLFLNVADQLQLSRYTVLIRYLLGVKFAISPDRLIEILNSASSRELNGIFGLGAAEREKIIADLAVNGSFQTVAKEASAKLVLAFDKANYSSPDSGIKTIIDTWFSSFTDYHNETEKDDFDTRCLDQLVLKYKIQHPEVFDQYSKSRLENRNFKAVDDAFNTHETFNNAAYIHKNIPLVAVCISGELRGYQEAFKSIRPFLFEGIEPLVFVDTWDEVGKIPPNPEFAGRIFSGEFLKAYQSVCSEIGFPAVKSRYPILTSANDGSKVSAEELANVYSCPLDHIRLENFADEKLRNFTNPQKVYHKIRGVHKLAKDSGGKFDGYLRIRPDKSVRGLTLAFDWSTLLHQSYRDNSLFADVPVHLHSWSGLVMGDQAAISAPSVMESYAQAEEFSTLANPLNWTDWPSKPRPNVNLAYSLWLSGIKVPKIPVNWGPLIDPASQSSLEIFNLLERECACRTLDKYDQKLLDAARLDMS